MSGDLSISASGCREQLRSANKAPWQLWNIHVWRYIVDYALKKYQMNQDVSDEQLYQLTLIRWRFANILSWNISIVVSELLLTGIDKARHDVEFLMTQFPELEAWSRKIKERSSEENVIDVDLDQMETDRLIKQYGDVLFKVIVAQSKYIKLLERRTGE